MALTTNFYRFNFTNPKKNQIFKYAVKFTPEVPDNSGRLRGKIVNKVRAQLQDFLGFFIFMGGCCYSLENAPDVPALQSEFDEVKYELEFKWVQVIGDEDNERLIFYKIFFNSLLRKLKLKQIGRNYFNPKQSKVLAQHNLEVWPGFQANLALVERGVLLNVDVCHKVIRTDTVLDFINDLKHKSRGDPQEEIKRCLVGATVMTSYNKRTYKVDDVDFALSLEDTFSQDDGSAISYRVYFKQKYNQDIKDLNQPALVNVSPKTGNKIFLVPELCQMTGLSESMRANFQLMKDMAAITNTEAARRLQECKHLLEMFQITDKCREEMKQWQIEISDAPLEIAGQKLSAGNLVMGKTGTGLRIQFDVESSPDIDRKIQAQMYEQPSLLKWGVFFSEYDRKVAQQFVETMQKCCEQFKYQASKPREFCVKGTRFADWERAVKENLNASVQAIVLILPGQKNKAPLYDDLKKLLLREVPVPSQVVLSNTIARGKNVRSICNKILIQICAKIGGEPWAMSDMPFFDKPTMICGLALHSKLPGQKSVLSFTASVNQRATKFWSCAKLQEDALGVGSGLQSVMREALEEFKRKNEVYPETVVVYRDGVGDSQRAAVLAQEVPQIEQAFASLGTPARFTLVLVNKRVNQRLFSADGS